MTTQEILQGVHDWTNGKIVYDISVAHPDGQGKPTPYADLTAALGTGGANIPQGLRKGGMSVKFIKGSAQGSDNKYVQHRLMADEFTTDTTQWAVDDSGVYVENPEFIRVYTDKDRRILWAIKTDGTIYYGAGVPQQVVEYIQQKIDELSLDEYEDIVTFLGNLIEGDTLATLLNAKANVADVNTALNTKVDKVTGKSLIDDEYATGISYVENLGFAVVYLDNEDKILFGVKVDGDFYFGYGVPSQIVDYVNSHIDEIQAEITASLANKVDKVAGKGLIQNEVSESLYAIEDPEGRTEITTDTEGKIISYRDDEGVKHEECGIETKSIVADSGTFGAITFDTEEHKEAFIETLDVQKKNEVKIREFDLPKNGTVDIVSETFYLTANADYSDLSGVYPIQVLENNTTNAWNKRICQVYYLKSSLKDNQDGTYSLYNDDVSEHDIPLHFYASSAVKEENGVYIGTASITKVNGICYYTDTLWLDESAGRYVADAGSIKVVAQDEPVEQSTKTFSEQVTQLTNVPNVQAWAVNKKTEHNCAVSIDFGDYLTGNFFVKIKFQGSSTLRYPKRNFRFTFYKKKDYAKKLKLKIGEMPRLSGYNLKAFYPDATRVREYTLNRIAFAIWENRPKGDLDYPWNKNGNFYTGATGMIKAFPAKVSLGGTFYGFELFGLKKDENNYLLDGDDDTSGIFVSGEAGRHSYDARGWADEMGVDDRQPAFPDWEDSVSVETASAINSFFKYVIGTFKDSNNIEYEYYQLRKINEIFYVESTLTYDATTGTYSVNESSIATTRTISFSKDTAPEHMSIIDWIDYLIVAEVFYLSDNFTHNVILYTGRDKRKFYPFLYDLDGSFTVSDWNLDALSRWDPNNNLSNDTFYGVFYDEFKDLLHNRYIELRKSILNIQYVKAVLDDVYSNIPEEWLTLEQQKWGNAGYKLYYTLEYLDKRLTWIDNNLFNIQN